METLLESILSGVGLDPKRSAEVEITGRDPIHATRFAIGEAAAATLGACGVAASDLWELRTGRRQESNVEVAAAAAALLSFIHLRPVSASDSLSEMVRRPATTVAFYPARGGEWVHLHGGFPHLHQGLIELLGCGEEASSIAAAVAQWDARELEDEIAARRLCGARLRSAAEWRAHPQSLALADLPLVEIRKLGDSDPEPLPEAQRPLSGIRVLDLTRVLAGPTCARTLAEHGADVLRIHAPHLPTIRPFAVDTGHGKLSAHLDLESPEDTEKLRALLREGDVFSQGYRAGALARRGFAPEDLAALRPGVIAVSINCYGHEGPWRERAGWEQLAQTVTGIAAEQGSLERPALLPAAATDYTTGYLGALGAMAALARRARDGGSYEVRVSLSRTGMWLLEQDRVDGAPQGVGAETLARYLATSETPEGAIGHLGPVLRLSETPPRWERPSAPPGTHPPAWPDR